MAAPVHASMSPRMRDLSEDLLRMVMSALHSDVEMCVLELLRGHNERGDEASPCRYLRDDGNHSLYEQVRDVSPCSSLFSFFLFPPLVCPLLTPHARACAPAPTPHAPIYHRLRNSSNSLQYARR